MKKILLIGVFIVLLPVLSQAQIDVYFSPNGGCQEAVINQIKQAHERIDIAMYYLTSRPILQALVKAQERQVHIRIVLDQGQEVEDAAKSGYLIKHDFLLKYHLGFGLMHNKFAVIDEARVITGSFNWTTTAEERNEENLLIINDAQVAQTYEERFDYLWNTSRPDSRNARGLDAVPAWDAQPSIFFVSN